MVALPEINDLTLISDFVFVSELHTIVHTPGTYPLSILQRRPSLSTMKQRNSGIFHRTWSSWNDEPGSELLPPLERWHLHHRI